MPRDEDEGTRAGGETGTGIELEGDCLRIRAELRVLVWAMVYMDGVGEGR